MGLGKTFTGSEKLIQLNTDYNLLICQKSKIDDWIEHFKTHYDIPVIDFTKKGTTIQPGILIINYELCFRRPILKSLTDFTLMLDESSMISHDTAKRTKFITKLKPTNVILLSGTPCGGRYENLLSQCHLLGWNISKELFYSQYIITENLYLPGKKFPVKKVVGYKNIDRLKEKLRSYGAVFMETEEALELPAVVDQIIKVQTTKEYRKFSKDRIIEITLTGYAFKDDSDFDGKDVTPRVKLIGDTALTKMLYMRQLCGQYNPEKIAAYKDLLESTDDRLIVFYNFTGELNQLKKITDRPISIINGETKDLTAYNNCDNSVTFVQYQAGGMGLNLQKSNQIVYYSPPHQWELYEQSKARIRRIGQEKTCFYYYLTCKNSIEEKIYDTLKLRKSFDQTLFEKEYFS